MDRQFQNRLVGTIVLVALGVIFLPDLLDGKKAQVVEEFTEIPLRPMNQGNVNEPHYSDDDFQVIDIPQGQDLGELDAQSADQSADQPIAATTPEANTSKAAGSSNESKSKPSTESKQQSSSQEKAQPKAEKQVAAKPKPVAGQIKPVAGEIKPVSAGYTLQLGGFNNAKNVSALIAQLRLSGYTAYTVPAKPVDGKLTRVFVGPETNKAKLEKARDPIRKLTGLEGKIVPFSPTN
ncbi:cell division protein DedD [Shewanella sp. WXL01]|uniref:Cell division protein DedD n=1 Tax=Shewanella maritima TaxID=2520507 RepID=A0A411PDM7_9GAMM|nr:cell division protein DedD [Shewanella maritima]NKF50263.1 cell division protein DedD [Shewanella sp. WXL01]QBF81707.1 cell division protein DedD [Shewanella maritima]